MQYGERIKQFRKEAGITQEELGKMVGKKQNQVSEWEIGRIEPTLEDVLNICKALNVSANRFYGINDEYELAIDYSKDKGITPEQVKKAIELYLLLREK